MESENIKETLLLHLLDSGYDPQDYIDILDNIEQGRKDLEDYKIHPEAYDTEEMGYVEGDIEDWNEELAQMQKGWWKCQTDKQMEDEAEIIRQWIREHEQK